MLDIVWNFKLFNTSQVVWVYRICIQLHQWILICKKIIRTVKKFTDDSLRLLIYLLRKATKKTTALWYFFNNPWRPNCDFFTSRVSTLSGYTHKDRPRSKGDVPLIPRSRKVEHWDSKRSWSLKRRRTVVSTLSLLPLRGRILSGPFYIFWRWVIR